MQAFDWPAFLSMANATPGFFHDLRDAHFILQRRKLSTQARKQLNENAFNPWVKWLAVAIEQPNRSQVLHDSSRLFAVGRRRDKRFVSVTTLVFTTLQDV